MLEYSDWAPSVEEVAGLLRARTKVRSGAELGTFTEPDDPLGETRPTKKQVEGYIQDAQETVGNAAYPCEDHDKIISTAKGLAKLYAAMEVELSFFPEQAAQGTSPYDKYKELYDERLPKYEEAVSENCPGGEGSEDAAGGLSPRGYFGDTRPLGMDTVM